MPNVSLKRMDFTVADVLGLVHADLMSRADIRSPHVALEIKLTLSTAAGDKYPLAIKISLSDEAEGMRYSFETSHHAHTPLQAMPYVTSRSYGATVHEAIQDAIDSVKGEIDRAIQKGHSFEDAWLVVNPDYQ